MKSTSKIILASGSPRRKALLSELGIKFEVMVKDIEENYPADLKREQVALYIASKKADAYINEINSGALVITADTIVCLDDHILGKPTGPEDAYRMLRLLSGTNHEVITAVCMRSKLHAEHFHVTTRVHFHELTDAEIDYYIQKDKPFDKAGAYGIQEWIGLIGIDRIEGSYYNVVGLPVSELYQHLIRFQSISAV